MCGAPVVAVPCTVTAQHTTAAPSARRRDQRTRSLRARAPRRSQPLVACFVSYPVKLEWSLCDDLAQLIPRVHHCTRKKGSAAHASHADHSEAQRRQTDRQVSAPATIEWRMFPHRPRMHATLFLWVFWREITFLESSRDERVLGLHVRRGGSGSGRRTVSRDCLRPPAPRTVTAACVPTNAPLSDARILQPRSP